MSGDDRLACLRTIAAEAREMAARADAIGEHSKAASLRYLASHYGEEVARLAVELAGSMPT